MSKEVNNFSHTEALDSTYEPATMSDELRQSSFLSERRSAYLATLAITGCLALFGAKGSAEAAPGERSAALPPQGLYEGCSPGTELESCTDNLERIGRGGFRYVLNYSSWYGSSDEITAYADTAQSLGLELIWPLNHPAWRNSSGLSENYYSLGEEWDEPTNPQFIANAINLVKGHPATWGFYIGDEVSPSQAPEVKNLSDDVRELAPEMPQLYVGRPQQGKLSPFLDFADMVAVDPYPIGSTDPSVRKAVQRTQKIADTEGIPTATVLQSFSWSQYHPDRFSPAFPTRQQMRNMRDAALKFSDPKMILWYSYQDIMRSEAPQAHWNDLVHAAFSPVKQQYRSLHHGRLPYQDIEPIRPAK